MSRLSPRFLRWLRTKVFLDMRRIEDALPSEGTVLEVGCGYGHVMSYCASRRPDLQFVGIDSDGAAIQQATRMWPLPNVSFRHMSTRALTGSFDLVMLIDVVHHLTRDQEREIVDDVARCLVPRGRILLKDMDYGRCTLGTLLDTHISRTPPAVRTNEELCAALGRFKISGYERGRKLGIGYVQIVAQVKTEDSRDPQECGPISDQYL